MQYIQDKDTIHEYNLAENQVVWTKEDGVLSCYWVRTTSETADDIQLANGMWAVYHGNLQSSFELQSIVKKTIENKQCVCTIAPPLGGEAKDGKLVEMHYGDATPKSLEDPEASCRSPAVFTDTDNPLKTYSSDQYWQTYNLARSSSEKRVTLAVQGNAERFIILYFVTGAAEPTIVCHYADMLVEWQRFTFGDNGTDSMTAVIYKYDGDPVLNTTLVIRGNCGYTRAEINTWGRYNRGQIEWRPTIIKNPTELPARAGQHMFMLFERTTDDGYPFRELKTTLPVHMSYDTANDEVGILRPNAITSNEVAIPLTPDVNREGDAYIISFEAFVRDVTYDAVPDGCDLPNYFSFAGVSSKKETIVFQDGTQLGSQYTPWWDPVDRRFYQMESTSRLDWNGPRQRLCRWTEDGTIEYGPEWRMVSGHEHSGYYIFDGHNLWVFTRENRSGYDHDAWLLPNVDWSHDYYEIENDGIKLTPQIANTKQSSLRYKFATDIYGNAEIIRMYSDETVVSPISQCIETWKVDRATGEYTYSKEYEMLRYLTTTYLNPQLTKLADNCYLQLGYRYIFSYEKPHLSGLGFANGRILQTYGYEPMNAYGRSLEHTFVKDGILYVHDHTINYTPEPEEVTLHMWPAGLAKPR